MNWQIQKKASLWDEIKHCNKKKICHYDNCIKNQKKKKKRCNKYNFLDAEEAILKSTPLKSWLNWAKAIMSYNYELLFGTFNFQTDVREMYFIQMNTCIYTKML